MEGKKQKIDKLAKQKEIKEQSECTFRPSISPTLNESYNPYNQEYREDIQKTHTKNRWNG